MKYVLDASALLAWLHREAGYQLVAKVLDGALISAVNWSEVLQKSLLKGIDVDGLSNEVSQLGLIIKPFTISQADNAALLWSKTYKFGLSLGDRACIALGIEHSAKILTADKTWGKLNKDLKIQLIR